MVGMVGVVGVVGREGFYLSSKRVLYMEILQCFCETVDRRTACKTCSGLPKTTDPVVI